MVSRFGPGIGRALWQSSIRKAAETGPQKSIEQARRGYRSYYVEDRKTPLSNRQLQLVNLSMDKIREKFQMEMELTHKPFPFTFANRTTIVDTLQGGEEFGPSFEKMEQQRMELTERALPRSSAPLPEEARIIQHSILMSIAGADTLIQHDNGLFDPDYPLEGKANSPSIIPNLTGTDSIQDFKTRQSQAQTYIQSNQKFKTDIKEIQKNTPQDELSKKLLDYFITNKNSLNDIQQGDILRLLWDLDDYDRCVELVTASQNDNFKNNPDTMILYAQAQLKGNFFNLEHVEKIIETLKKRGYKEPELDSLKGVVSAIKMNTARQMIGSSNDLSFESSSSIHEFSENFQLYKKCFPKSKLTPEEYYENYFSHLQKSLSNYKEAWEKSLDPRYGIRVIHRQMELKKVLESVGEIEQAKKIEMEIEKLAIQVQIACLRDGVDNPSRGQDHQALSRAMLEAILVSGSSVSAKEGLDLDWIVNRTILGCDTPSRTKYAIMSLNNLMCFHPRPSEIEPFISKLQQHLKNLEESSNPKAYMEDLRKKEKCLTNRSTQLIESYATDYKRASNVLHPGNACYGGVLPEHNINKNDRKFFENMLEIPLEKFALSDEILIKLKEKGIKNLGDIEDPREFSFVLNDIIRAAFGSADGKLERLDSPEHVLYDKTVLAIYAYLGAETPELRKYLPDTQTGISVSFSFGIGDCRHHAQVKQLLFDLWQKKKIGNLASELAILDAKENPNADDEAKKVILLMKIENAMKVQMRILHCEFHGPINKISTPDHGYSVPEWSDGTMMKRADGKEILIEEHTFNALFFYDDKGEIKQVEKADSFYHTTYPLKEGMLDIVDRPFSPTAEPIIAFEIEVLNRISGEKVMVPIRIRPTSYSGSGGKYDPSNATSKFMGIPCDLPNGPEAIFTPERRENLQTLLRYIRELYEKK